MKFSVVSYICASELALTVALVVFVMLTVLLAAVIVLLCASKSFRAFMFREKHAEDEKPTAEQTAAAEPVRAEEQQPKPRRKKRDDLFGGVETVPLTFMGADLGGNAPAKSARQRNNAGNDGITTVEIPAMTSAPEKTTYTPRSVARKKSGQSQIQSTAQSENGAADNKNSKTSRHK